MGGVSGQVRGQLSPAADAELLKDAGQVSLNGAPGDEKVLCDRPIAVPAGSECGHPQLRRGQRVDAEQGVTAGPGTRGVELLTSPPGE